jgi:hypothetical protein
VDAVHREYLRSIAVSVIAIEYSVHSIAPLHGPISPRLSAHEGRRGMVGAAGDPAAKGSF